MQEYIFIVGKADPLNAAAQAIRRAGFKVGIFQDSRIAIRSNADFDKLLQVDFKRPVPVSPDMVKDIPIAGLLATYENYIVARSEIGLMLGLPVPSIETARCCTDKLLMRQAFRTQNQTLSPAFTAITSADDAIAFARTYRFPVIIKPANLVKSLLITRCDTEQALVESVEHALADIQRLYAANNVYGREPQLIIEQFMEGELYSVAAFADTDGEIHMSPGITALVGAQQIGHNDNYLYKRTLPAVIDDALQDKMFRVAREGSKALGLRSTAAHIELIHTNNNEVKLIEIGARIGGYRPRMYRLSYGIDLYETELAVATGKPLTDSGVKMRGHTSVYELFPDAEGKFDHLAPQDTVDDLGTIAHSINLKLHRGEQCGPAKDGFKAVAVIIIHDSDASKFASKIATVEKLRVCLQ
jgi:biotin carboxylase